MGLSGVSPVIRLSCDSPSIRVSVPSGAGLMSIFSFVDQDELDNLDEDPRIAFMELANIVVRKLHEKTIHLDDNEQREWREIEELRFSCMNVLLAAAKRLEVEPFASMDVPPYDENRSSNWQTFKFDLEHYITQIVLDNSTRNRSGSVGLLPKTKDQIRSYIKGLRGCIEKGNMDEKKREALLSKLDALEQELEKRRVSMMTIAKIAYHLWAVPGSMYSSYDIANKLITNVMQTVAEAKAEEDAKKQIAAPAPVKALSAPRKSEPPQEWGGSKSTEWGSGLDDDIPF